MTPEQITQSREERIHEAAKRAHALLMTARGTAQCPTLTEVRESIRFVLTEAVADPDYQDVSLFATSAGCWIQIHREGKNRHWDYFEVLVPATPRFTWMRDVPEPPEKEARYVD